MKGAVAILFFLVSIADAQTTHKYFIRFSDKDNSLFSINQPSSFLSQRSIDRRAKQNISITEQDLPVNGQYVTAVQGLGGIVLTRSKWFNGVTVECDSASLQNILSLPFVLSSKKVFRESTPRIKKNIWTGYPLNHLSALRVTGEDYGSSFNQIHLMNGEYLHEQGYKGDGILIALLDAGFYSVDSLMPFERLRMNGGIVNTWDFVSNESDVYDNDTHGMSVLSTIAGYVPGMLIGTAPDASFLLLRSEDASTENIIEEYNWDAAAEYADSAGADVISSSLGYTLFDDTAANHSYADMDGDHCPSSIAADIAVSKGMLVINSAGNSGGNSWHYIGAPSDGDSVISVAATDSSGRHVGFSSFGPAPDGRIKPNVAAKGYRSTLADGSGSIVEGSGTSFSCPILAGSASCLWQAFPNATAIQVKTAIERSANLYNTPNDSLGYGIPDFRLAAYLLSTGNSPLPTEDKLLSVYPNPFSDELSLRFYSEATQQIRIEMYNTTGQLVEDRFESVNASSLNIFSIAVSNKAPGLYIIKLSSSSNSFTQKAVKTH